MTYSKRKLSELLIKELIQNGNTELFEDIIHDDYGLMNSKNWSTSNKWVVAKSLRSSIDQSEKKEYQIRTPKDRFRKVIEIQSNWQAWGLQSIYTITNYFENQDESAVFYSAEIQIQDTTKLQDGVIVSDSGYEVIDYKKKFVFDGVHLIKFKDNKIIGLHFIWDTLSWFHGLGIVGLNKDPDTVFSQYYENIKESGLLD